jgi:hypothetical protein
MEVFKYILIESRVREVVILINIIKDMANNGRARIITKQKNIKSRKTHLILNYLAIVFLTTLIVVSWLAETLNMTRRVWHEYDLNI